MEKKNNSCIIYGSWYDGITKLSDKAEAFDFLKALMDYQFFGEYDNNGNEHIDAFMQQAMFALKTREERYGKSKVDGKKGGRASKVDEIRLRELLDMGKSKEELAAEFGCSTRTVERAIDKMRQNDKSFVDKTSIIVDKSNVNTENVDKTATNEMSFCRQEWDF